MSIKFEIDAKIRWRITGDTPKDSVLAGWLSSDIQSSQIDARQIISKINKATEGKLSEWIRTGNAYTFSIEDYKCQIREDYSEPTITYDYSFEEIEDAARKWEIFIRQNAL
jgi:uncharacterized protein YacL (UPF0231 family)